MTVRARGFFLTLLILSAALSAAAQPTYRDFSGNFMPSDNGERLLALLVSITDPEFLELRMDEPPDENGNVRSLSVFVRGASLGGFRVERLALESAFVQLAPPVVDKVEAAAVLQPVLLRVVVAQVAAIVKRPGLQFRKMHSVRAGSDIASEKLADGQEVLVLKKNQGRLAQAVTDFERVVDLGSPHAADAQVNLAVAHARLGQPDKAREHLRAALTLNPNHKLALSYMQKLERRPTGGDRR